MAARNRGGIHGAIPWIALIVVTIFAFNQLCQRNRLQKAAARAQDDLLTMPTEVSADSEEAVVHAEDDDDVVTDRERQLDTALQAALELTRADTKRIAMLEGERADERARADRLAAVQTSEGARAEALTARCAGLAAEAETAVRELEDAELQAQARGVTAVEELEALRKRLAAADQRFKTTYQRVVQQLALSAAALTKAERSLRGTSERLAESRERREMAEKGMRAAGESLSALRLRLLAAVTAQLASEHPIALVTGARMVGLLGLSGSAARLLALTDHEEPTVASAAARALARAGDLQTMALEASEAALALMADDAIGMRMAGLELLRAVTGKEIEFEVGGSVESRATAWKKLSQQLGS